MNIINKGSGNIVSESNNVNITTLNSTKSIDDIEFDQLKNELCKLLQEYSNKQENDTYSISILNEAIEASTRKDKTTLIEKIKSLSINVLSFAKELSLNVLTEIAKEHF